MFFENARCACDPDPIHLYASGVAKKVDIWGQPTSMIAVKNASQLRAFTDRDAALDLTVPIDGWTLRDSHR
jgi:hypothetical protein